MSSITLPVSKVRDLAGAKIERIKKKRKELKDKSVNELIQKNKSRWFFPQQLTYGQAEAILERADPVFQPWLYVYERQLDACLSIKHACDTAGVDTIRLSLNDYVAISE